MENEELAKKSEQQEGKSVDKDCSQCLKQRCRKGKNCYPEINRGIMEKYNEPENLKMSRASAAIEARHYMQQTRLEETRLFAREMGYTRMGIAACVGLVREVQTITEYMRKEFEVYMVVCKNGGHLKNSLNYEQIKPDSDEVMCNPIGQALFLNQKKTDMNIICGLCVGLDMLFTKYSDAPVTTIIVKDRVLAHNPAAVLYSGYYRKNILEL
ncbi:MAG: DUF1847 domain-containing protein [Syntrophomonadaceae bacterium]|jgi:uncharacterized metal-binding protein|nr:DUF1847 domain-containing protein [Syntrophomonadaceae bacterium]